MNNKKFFGIISILILFISGCTVTKIFYPGSYSYTANKKDITLVIYLVDPLLRIDFHGNLPEEFGKGDQNERIYNFFKEQLRRDLDSLSSFKNIQYGQLTSNHVTQEIPVRIPARGEKIFDLPVNNSTIEFSHNTADFVLFLDEVSIVSRYRVDDSQLYEPVYNPYTGSMTRRRVQPSIVNPSKDLTYESKFILWDNISGVPVSYGYVRSMSANKKAISLEDWLKVSEMYVSKLFEGSPFQVNIPNKQ